MVIVSPLFSYSKTPKRDANSAPNGWLGSASELDDEPAASAAPLEPPVRFRRLLSRKCLRYPQRDGALFGQPAELVQLVARGRVLRHPDLVDGDAPLGVALQ